MKDSEFGINGLVFFPQLSGINIIHSQSKDSIKEKKHIFANLEIMKTDIVDVYKLFLQSNNCKEEIGIAHIPTMECSHMCQNIFEKKNNIVIMKCVFNKKFRKWTPIEKTLLSKPDKYEYVCQKLKRVID